MGGDLISRQAAIDAIANCQSIMPKNRISAVEVIDALPSAQPDLESAYAEGYTAAESKYRAMMDERPEVIRCKECKCWIDNRCRSRYANLYDWRRADDYCSRAERMK